MIPELAVVMLTEDITAAGLKAGDLGTVVHVHANGIAYEVEFVNFAGETLAVETIPAGKLRSPDKDMIQTARRL